MSNEAVIKRCGCKGNPSHASDFQDSKYGSGMRVCTVNQKKTEGYCTVCGKVHKI